LPLLFKEIIYCIAEISRNSRYPIDFHAFTMNVTATELKNRLGRYLEAAQVEPVVIEKSGRVTSVVLSKHRYDQLCELEDMFWDLTAQTAENEGYMSDFEVTQLLQARE
jgi:prevent-host-death family protein